MASGDLMENTISSCLEMLKVDDADARKRIMEIAASASPEVIAKYGQWITAIKAASDYWASNNRMFGQAELCDFLTVAAKGIDPKKADTKPVSDATFHIYMDIMQNYAQESDETKVHFPRIITDVISILDRGFDTKGEAVGLYGIERYYQKRKTEAIAEDPLAGYSATPVAKPAAEPREPLEFDSELIENMAGVTARSKKDLERSLLAMSAADIKKISDLSRNYKRLQKYRKTTNSAELKKMVEKDLGRKLSDNQMQHAANSVKKTQIYIENLIDGKFVPHGTHGINHVKHNLEYGFQIMGLIEPRKRKQI
ncbi:MAG: hypothetical protein DA330_06915 [Nitrososphaera sp.]|nr:hypothetical protein [Nitrososphaera sp.]